MSEGYKKAALRIHGLSEPDRRWVLDRLPERERKELDVFLAQLGDMKVPGGYPTFSDLFDKASADHGETIASGHVVVPSKTDLVNAADLSVVMTVLANEPDWLIALVLISGAWSWTESYVRSLDDGRRARVYALIKQTTPQLPPKLQDAVVELLAQALSPEQKESDDTAISRFSMLFRKFGADTVSASENPGRAS